MKDLKSLYNISLYILNNNPYGKNEPMELGLFSRILFESEASQLLATGMVRIKDYWEIDKKKDIILPISFKEILSSDNYKIWLEDDKICTDQEVNLDYLSQYTREVLDNELKVYTKSGWTVDTWYNLRMSPCYRESVVLLRDNPINPLTILDYVYSNIRTYTEEQFNLLKELGEYQ